MPRWLLGVVCALALPGTTGCARSARVLAQEAEDRARLEEVRRESRELDELLANTEARLLHNRGAANHWRELAQRHGNVSALACKSASLHVEQMNDANHKQRRKKEVIARRRLAEGIGPTATDAHVSGVKVPASTSGH
ncbi:MAG: hypothetical protein ACK4N5_09490 [Myxococcales bacterium]